MTRRKKLCLFSTVIIIIVIICGLFYLNMVNRYQNTVKNMTFQEIDFSNIADGVYTGECDVNFISAKVQVTMKDGKIQNLELLEHKNDRGQAAEAMISIILNAQKLEVDTISGATNSSKVIKKAVENALTKTPSSL